MKMNIHLYDTETASLNGGIVEIALAVLDENLNILFQADSLIDPERPIDPSAMGVHHITDEMVWDKPTLQEWHHMEAYPFKVDNLVTAGHNVAFDDRMCAEILPPRTGSICTLKLSRMVWPDAPDHKLQTLRYMLKLDAGDAHRAMGDVRACVSMLRLIRDIKGWSAQDMLTLCSKPLSPEDKISFGKHKGSKFKDLPLSYRSWMLKQDSLNPAIARVLKSL